MATTEGELYAAQVRVEEAVEALVAERDQLRARVQQLEAQLAAPRFEHICPTIPAEHKLGTVIGYVLDEQGETMRPVYAAPERTS